MTHLQWRSIAISLSIVIGFCSSSTAQTLDTVFIHHKVSIAADDKLYSARRAYDESSSPFGNSEADFIIQPTSRNEDDPSCFLSVFFMDDSVTTLKEWKQQYLTSSLMSNNTFLIDSAIVGSTHYYVLRTIPDECKADINDSPIIHVHGFMDIGEDFFMESYYTFMEKKYKHERWKLAKMLNEGLMVRTIKQADDEMHYPYTKSHVDSTITNTIARMDTSEYTYFLKKRKCFDDRYLIELLEREHGKSTIAALIAQHNDPALASLYRDYRIAEYKEEGAQNLADLYETQYTISETYHLKRRLRDEVFPAEDYFDMHTGLKRSSIFKRMDELNMLTVPQSILSYSSDVLKIRYAQAMLPYFGSASFQIDEASFRENGKGFLWQISGKRTPTGKNEYLMLSAQPDSVGGFSVQQIPMPVMKKDGGFGVWDFVKSVQQDYIILFNNDEYVHYIAPTGDGAKEWQAMELFNFKSNDVLVYNQMEIDDVKAMEVDDYYVEHGKWKGEEKRKFEAALLKYEEYSLIELDESPHTDYLIDEDARNDYKEEYNEDALWDYYFDLPIFINDTAYIDGGDYLDILTEYLHPKRQGYLSPLYVDDLDGDSINDVFQFSYVNGELVHYHFFTRKDDEVVRMKNKQTQKLIANYSDAINLKQLSLMGNFWSDNKFFQYLYSREPRRLRFTGTPSF